MGITCAQFRARDHCQPCASGLCQGGTGAMPGLGTGMFLVNSHSCVFGPHEGSLSFQRSRSMWSSPLWAVWHVTWWLYLVNKYQVCAGKSIEFGTFPGFVYHPTAHSPSPLSGFIAFLSDLFSNCICTRCVFSMVCRICAGDLKP